ncbi:DEAD/DEAH box helicase [Ruegeria sp. HKCCA0370]|uniref:DEAD/DEAH box helicase n=1 Tax=Ruegeria sp. HKCCA0370 TaxID=2682995 RepID=UPI00148961A5|nr:AAA domain-containing protein [Ruegeria sp. HKCCA0370]
MPSRPYFNKSIKELEALFAQNSVDAAVLTNLKAELGFRNTQRALTLKSKVLAANESTPKAAPKTKTNIKEPSTRGKVEPKAETPAQPAPVQPTVKQMTLKRSDLGPKPPVENSPQDILRAWTALEVLSPQGYKREADLAAGDTSRIARFDERDLPWELGERSRPKKRLYYELILGAIALAPAVEELLKLYSDNRPDKPSMKGFCPIASVLLDKEGRPLEEDTSAAISSFAWGVPIALQGDLKALADWPHQEKQLMGEFKKRLIRRDRNDDVIPLSKKHIAELFDHLVQALNLAGHEIKAPYFALRRYEFFASKTPPEPGLLNSFFLEDLALARTMESSGALPHALKHYLGIAKPPRQTDLLENDAGLQHLLQPALSPLGRWPGKGRYPLALLQQAAVNATDKRLMETGVLAVNGPPGTGKTTLLRDVVAARLIERAKIMCELKKPASAFTPTNQSLQRSGAKITLHKLDERLKGFEMVVASSNNKAVENVSAELPALEAIAEDAPELRYFKSISDKVLERDTWGIIAAVLGNSSNRYLFSQAFWRDEENGLSTYLNHASGLPQIVSEPQDDGPPIKRNREIVDAEKPPANAREAQLRWDNARKEFLQALKTSQKTRSMLQDLHKGLVRLVEIANALDDLHAEQPKHEEELEALSASTKRAQEEFRQADEIHRGSERDRGAHYAGRPGFFARLFRTSRFRDWQRRFDELTAKVASEKTVTDANRTAFDNLRSQLSTKQRITDEAKSKITALQTEEAQLRDEIKAAKNGLNVPMPDADFFALAHEDIQIANVWFDETANRERDLVFETAIALHRAFIDCAADPIRQNLSIFVESFGTRSLGTPQKDALIADMWASFFLVVPVVSTTFASVHRMLSRLPAEALGWLLVDEAGQALPQAAVGAMIRTKNSVVVGDPLQIEPVVTLPNSLTEEICGFFGIDPLKFNAPEASVQTVADAASMYCARFPIGSGHRDVGAPLLVHRRCDSPMFEISNEIAYANLMVQAKKPSSNAPVLGRSSWINVVGKPGPDKWCADEATVLIDLLRKLRDAGENSDLYIVTPFVIVQNNLRQELLRSGVLDGWTNNPNAWVWEHVGTVHTVQGREASTVFFVLGAQGSSQNGARNWAGSRPNLVNVAVTRAQTSLYVIGNRQLWKNAGVFAALDRYLPDGASASNP